jgi:hypothetical protein
MSAKTTSPGRMTGKAFRRGRNDHLRGNRISVNGRNAVDAVASVVFGEGPGSTRPILPLEGMPQEVPEVFVDYLRRLNASPHPDAPVSDDAFIRAAQTVATVSLGKNLVPQDFTPEEATEALKRDAAAGQARVLLDRLIASGVI